MFGGLVMFYLLSYVTPRPPRLSRSAGETIRIEGK